MKYVFERNGKLTTVMTSMDDIGTLTDELTAKGFRRVYTTPQIYHQLDYNAAYDEMVEMDRAEALRTKKAGDEAWRDVAEIAQSY